MPKLTVGELVGDFEECATQSKQLAIIMHGLGGHRDYCYQKRLGIALTGQGFHTFRFDFRGCGDSAEVPDPSQGRSIHGTDYDDLDVVYKYFTLRGYTISCMVGHSRSVACMFVWQLRNPDIFIPFYVNCSGRFDCMKVYDRVARDPSFYTDGGYWMPAKRYGKTKSLWYPKQEVDEYAHCDSNLYGNINPRSQVLTVFGLRDHIVPVEDSGAWANLFDGRGTIEMIPDADHNFYGKVDGKHVNYNPQVVEKICAWIEPSKQLDRWFNATHEISQTRWIDVEGVSNFRDFGGYGNAKPGIMFRCAALNKITDRGKQQIAQLGITDIFDLRSPAELKRDKTTPVQIQGIKTHFTPVFGTEDWSPQGIANRQKSLSQGGLTSAYAEIFEALVTTGTLAKIVNCAVQGGKILVHCTAGKDRTGVVCAVLLAALGVDDYTIAREYELTTIGYRGQREKLAIVLSKIFDKPLLEAMLESKFSTMQETLVYFRQHYGSILGYFKSAGLEAEFYRLQATSNAA